MVRTLAAALATTTCIVALATPAAAQTREYNIPAGSLKDALDAYVRQSGRQVIYRADQIRSAYSPGAQGSFSSQEALAALLRGSGFSTRTDGAITAIIKVEQRDTINLAPKKHSEIKAHSLSSEIIVTGTNIRGSNRTASPVETFTADDIQKSGQGTVKDFLFSIPQNYGGVANENTNQNITGGSEAGANQAVVSAVNLRALGPDATLLLVDGHRVAPGNTTGNWGDISVIPMAAIERIDVLLDGASANYGADAVGGVVNVIMKKRIDGAESRVRVGDTSDGGGREIQFSHSQGINWNNGSAVLAYEYYNRNNIESSRRTYTSENPSPTTLIPQQRRHSAFVSMNQDISPTTSIYALGNYAHRESVQSYAYPGYAAKQSAKVDTYSFQAGISSYISDDDVLDVSVSHGKTKTDISQYQILTDTYRPDIQSSAAITTADVKLSGSLFDLGVDKLKYAAGIQFRRETFNSSQYHVDSSRNIWAGFIEFDVKPVKQVSVNLATRYEHYGDFGSTTNPKIGVAWNLSSGLRATGTFGTSFRTPSLYELSPSLYNAVLTVQSDPAGGTAVVFVPYGGNPNLGPEKARTWTLGLQYETAKTSGIKVKAEYYNIRFRDRISTIDNSGFSSFAALNQEDILGSTIVQRDPSLDLLQKLVSLSPALYNYTNMPGVTLSDVSVLVDGRPFNLSTVKTSGVDLSLSYAGQIIGVQFDAGFESTYILEYERKALATTPNVSVLDTPYNPVSLRARGHLSFRKDNWNATAFVNYVDKYEDNRSSTVIPVSSWTTVDLSVSYQPAAHGVLQGTEFQLNAVNVFNVAPPFVASSAPTLWPGANFDGTNANPIGRFLSLQITKKW